MTDLCGYIKHTIYKRKIASAREARLCERFPSGRPETRRTVNALDLWLPGPITPEEVAKLTATELLNIPNFGRRCLRDVQDWLRTHGLELRFDAAAATHTILAESEERSELARLKAKYEK